MDLKKFTDIFNRIAHTQSYGTVFHDFLTITVCALSGGQYEDLYEETIKGYKKESVELFSHLFAEMVIQMDNDGEGFGDPLGEFFMLNITRGHNGQFFTPEPVTDMMAQMIVEPSHGKSFNDPACGSGRTMMSSAKVAGKNNLFYAADLDHQCAKMCAINFCLNGMRGQVAHMNTLSMEVFNVYEIYYDTKRLFVPTIRLIDKEKAGFIIHKEKIAEAAPVKQVIKSTEKPIQLNLF